MYIHRYVCIYVCIHKKCFVLRDMKYVSYKPFILGVQLYKRCTNDGLNIGYQFIGFKLNYWYWLHIYTYMCNLLGILGIFITI